MISATNAIVNQYGIQIGSILKLDRPIQLSFQNQSTQTKQCSDCKQFFPISEFSTVHRRKCKPCYNLYSNNIKHLHGKCKPYDENKKCTKYLGEHITEKLLLSTFSEISKAPMNNPGYDFICGNGFKVDVKSSCIHISTRKLVSGENKPFPHWQFHIRFNTTADYFALLAFDTLESLTPLHFWMIPGEVLNKKHGITITETTLHKWKQYEKPIDKILLECSTKKNGD